jgi:hypothetical protein
MSVGTKSLTRWFISLVFVTLGGALIALSGKAEASFFPISNMVFGAGLLFVPVSLYLTGRSIFRLIKGNKGRRRAGVDLGVNSGSLILFCALFLISGSINHNLEQETIARGDKVIEAIKAYRADRGRYPTSLAALRNAGFAVPAPALKNSEFWYSSDEPMALVFWSTEGRMCSRDPDKNNWHCGG